MKIALVHDDFVQAGGAESLFATIASLWPNAPIYTSLVDWHKLPQSISRDRIRPSFIQKIPFATKFYKVLLPLYPLAFESFNFDDFDVVISSTTRFAKSIITKPKTVHICYINSLPRFLWSEQIQQDYLSSIVRLILKPFLAWLKKWDLASSFRVDHYLANSQNIASQLKQHYTHQGEVIYPFADLNFFKIAKIHNWKLKSQNYYLVVSRLVKWKKIDIAIQAAQALKINLKIVGTGPDEARLKRLASHFVIPAKAGIQNHSSKSWIPNQVRDDRGVKIEFLGKVTKEKLRELYQNSRALIVTQQEDFGIAAVEAGACGAPVIGYQASGVSEIIENDKTGILFPSQSPMSIQDAINRQTKVKWTVSACRQIALKYSKDNFVRQLREKVRFYGKRGK